MDDITLSNGHRILICEPDKPCDSFMQVVEQRTQANERIKELEGGKTREGIHTCEEGKLCEQFNYAIDRHNKTHERVKELELERVDEFRIGELQNQVTELENELSAERQKRVPFGNTDEFYEYLKEKGLSFEPTITGTALAYMKRLTEEVGALREECSRGVVTITELKDKVFFAEQGCDEWQLKAEGFYEEIQKGRSQKELFGHPVDLSKKCYELEEEKKELQQERAEWKSITKMGNLEIEQLHRKAIERDREIQHLRKGVLIPNETAQDVLNRALEDKEKAEQERDGHKEVAAGRSNANNRIMGENVQLQQEIIRLNMRFDKIKQEER